MRILIAEDDPVTKRLLQVSLEKWGHEVISCPDGEAAWNIIRQIDGPKMVILDWMMPGMDGIAICREIRKLDNHPYIYVILLTSRSEKSDVIQGLEAGADDYVTKPFHPEELKVRVRAGARIIQLQEELTIALKTCEYKATHDLLTRLLNRAAIMDALKREIDRYHRDRGSLAVAILDIDHFKKINDKFGHLVGDKVLKELSKRMSSEVRSYDLIGRYGGEEFIVIMPGCDNQKAAQIAERLREVVSNLPISVADIEVYCTISIGVTSVTHGVTTDIDSLIREADEALYIAKKLGRNRVEVWKRS